MKNFLITRRFRTVKIYGNVLWQGRFEKGTLVIKEGYVEDFRRERDYDIRGTVIPTFINMHTHIGDFCAQDEPQGGIAEIVGPGGYKYRVLRSRKKVYWGMRRAMRYMQMEGISHFVDFREGGDEGVELLLKASRGFKIKPIIFARNINPESPGVGLSSISDYDRDFIIKTVRDARKEGKLFAIHVSERVREDIDFVLSLNPSFIVHMLEATDEDLRKVGKRGVPVVITPRSNLFFGKIPNIPRLLKYGITLALGTDNGMFSLPSMFREMEVAYKLSRIYGHVSPEEILKMATENPRKILGMVDNQIGEKARFIVFRRLMTPYELVNKSSPADIKRIVF